MVNIKGTGAAFADGLQAIGLRADIDALPMPENNYDLEYRSKTNHAHMCGHACLRTCVCVCVHGFTSCMRVCIRA